MIRLTFVLLLFVAAQPALTGKQPNRVANKTRGRSVVTFQSGLSLPVVKETARMKREHRDPNRSGNPLLDTGHKYRHRNISRNFIVGEYAHSGNVVTDFSRIDPKLVVCLQQIRDFVGKPVRIDSGYRSFQYNEELYWRRGEKPTRSQHISGRATDIEIANMAGTEIAEAAIDACGPDIGIGIGPRYAHIDVRGHFAIWKYKGVGNGQVAEVRQYREASRLALNRSKRGARRIKS